MGTQEVAIVALRRHVFRQGFQLGTPEVRVLQNDAVDPLLLNDGPHKKVSFPQGSTAVQRCPIRT